MALLIFSIIAFFVAIISCVISIVNYTQRNKATGTLFLCVCLICAILGGVLIISGTVTKVKPDEIGIAYSPSGETKNLNTGYNVVSILSTTYKWSSKAEVMTFSEGEASDDIFGGQTQDKDYITAVATLSVSLDKDRLSEYITMYGTQQISSDTITQLLKTIARQAIENVVSKYPTSDIMSHKDQINSAAVIEFKTLMAEQPIKVIEFSLKDLIAPESYEQSVVEQAELRQKTATAELQKQLNETEAAANKAKADGEAEVAKVEAEKAATVAKINAENAADVAKINATKESDVAKINAEKTANVSLINAENATKVAELTAEKNKITADNEAEIIMIKATAEASSAILAGDADATVAEALAKVYRDNPQMLELENKKIDAETSKAWAEKWAGLNLDGLTTVSWANVSELLNQLVGTAVGTTTSN